MIWRVHASHLWMRPALIALGAVALLILSLPMLGIADRFVYFPSRYPEGDWQALPRSGAEERWLATADDVRINAWYWPQPQPQVATLFLHGNGGNVTHRIDHAQELRRAGTSILIIDYRGYGKSDGTPTERGLYADADAGYAALLAFGFRPDQIVVHGESLGTAVAADLASRKPCAGLVLESPLASLKSMASKVVPVLGPLVATGFETESKVRKVHVPLMVIHGDADGIVPFAQGQAVFAAANEPKRFWRIPGGDHNTLLWNAGREYAIQLSNFYRSLYAPAPSNTPK